MLPGLPGVYLRLPIFLLFAAAQGTALGQAKAQLFTAPKLTEANKTYTVSGKTYKLGLYEGTNTIPAAHLAAGQRIARSLQLLNESTGKVDRTHGRIQMAVIGHSIPAGCFSGFSKGIAPLQAADSVNSKVLFVNAARGSRLAWHWEERYAEEDTITDKWNHKVNQILVTHLTWTRPGAQGHYNKLPYHNRADSIMASLHRILTSAKKRSPHLKMALINSDTYMGYSIFAKNPSEHEPLHGYEEALAQRQAILEQIKGNPDWAFEGKNAKVPYLVWGGYFWDPTVPESYYSGDKVHASGEGGAYVARTFLRAMFENPVTAVWFAGPKVPAIPTALFSPLARPTDARPNHTGLGLWGTDPLGRMRENRDASKLNPWYSWPER